MKKLFIVMTLMLSINLVAGIGDGMRANEADCACSSCGCDNYYDYGYRGWFGYSRPMSYYGSIYRPFFW